ncbi:lantibiotic dehydratase [Nocardiopsis sp. CA-288880]|uniref:lantibiotic dehydratase n=1 Tax=Nocardiopsis sp. CA-288880 TaxID=3239995 RepID=UPI003D9830C4
MYRLLHPTALTLRAATLPPTEGPTWPDPVTTDPAHLRSWTVHTWHNTPGFVDTLEVASPSLTHRLHTLAGSEAVPARRIRRTAVSLMRYLLRARTRPTPTGLFAGVAPLTVGERTRVRWGSAHLPIARPDPRWISAMAREHADRHDHDPLVVAAPTTYVQGDRLVLPWAPHESDPRAAESVSVRHTPVVAHLMAEARSPIPVGLLLQSLAELYPDARTTMISTAVDRLMERRILLSATRPPTWATDPLRHLADHLPGNQALQDALSALDRHNHPDTPAAQRRALRAEGTVRLIQAYPGSAGLALDTRLDADLTVPAPTFDQVPRAARELARLAPDHQGSPAWIDYHHRCLEAYGPGARVRLLELIGPTGIGLPATYRGSHLPLPPTSANNRKRNRALLAAVHDASLNGDTEIVVENTPALAPLTEPAHPTPHMEVRLQLHAPTPAAVDAGECTLWVTGVSRGAGTLTGRFSHLPDMAHSQAFHVLPTMTRDALPVQILAPPMAETATHINRTTAVAAHVLPIDEHPPANTQTVQLEHLVVHIDTDRLHLIDTARNRVIEPFQASALEPHHYTHPLARFCYELPRAHTAPHLMFTWPATTSGHRFLPRVRADRTVLAPAQWRLAPADLDDLSGVRPALPDRVLLVDGERHLGLELDQAAHRHLLGAHLDRHGTATVTEAPGADAFGWCQGRAHEIVVPLASTADPAPPPRPELSTPTARTTSGVEEARWVSIHLYTDPHLLTPLLTDRLPELWQLLDHNPDWWFVRYTDSTGPHLRLRLPAPTNPEPALRAWAGRLSHTGMLRFWSLRPYQPETGRYGHGPAMVAAETFFAADSTAALTQLGTAGEDPIRSHALTAVSLLHLTTTAQKTTWALHHLPRPRTPLHRPTRAATTGLWEQLRTRTLPVSLLHAWEQRAEALTAYLTHHTDPGAATTVLPSLLHMHHNRAHGPDRDDEHHAHALARALAHTHLRRHEGPVRR